MTHAWAQGPSMEHWTNFTLHAIYIHKNMRNMKMQTKLKKKKCNNMENLRKHLNSNECWFSTLFSCSFSYEILFFSENWGFEKSSKNKICNQTLTMWKFCFDVIFLRLNIGFASLQSNGNIAFTRLICHQISNSKHKQELD